MLSGVAELLAIDPELLDDLKTAVSEACNNVVLHAYDGVPGPLSVTLYVDQQNIEVVARDAGFPPAPPRMTGCREWGCRSSARWPSRPSSGPAPAAAPRCGWSSRA